MRLSWVINDEQAMWRVQHAEDHGAFAQLVQRWERPIQRLCARMLGDPHRGEDLAQETFARVFAQRHHFQAGHRFSTWLWRIAINLCQDELRRRQRRPESPWRDGVDSEGEGSGNGEAQGVGGDGEPGKTAFLGVGAAPDEVLVSREQAQWVRQGLDSLPEIYRTVLILRHYEGFKFAEIADILGIAEGTVKSRMVTALSRLRQILEETRDTKAPTDCGIEPIANDS